MTVRIYTARVSYGGADRLDITRKSATGYGLAFAPSWSLLRRFLNVRDTANALEREAVKFAAMGDEAGAAAMRRQVTAAMDGAWEEYVPAFRAEMVRSYIEQRTSWEWLLTQVETSTLCCYCTDPERCHRTLLARVILPRLGAVFCGEREAAEQRRGGVR